MIIIINTDAKKTTISSTVRLETEEHEQIQKLYWKQTNENSVKQFD